LIEKGYLYIAQPPLFKYKKGRIERYLKDEKALGNFLITSALSNAQVTIDGKDIQEEDVVQKVNSYIRYTKQLDSYDTSFDTPLLAELVRDTALTTSIFTDRTGLETRLNAITTPLNQRYDYREYSFEISEEDEGNVYQAALTVRTLARTKRFMLRQQFIESMEFVDLRDSWNELEPIMEKSFTYKKDRMEETFQRLPEFVEFVIAEGKRGAVISRYKGLGEMNPEQLWETTMDPENRRLLQVRLDDLAESDQVFSILMGTKVDPRREFVEENALNVRNLDI